MRNIIDAKDATSRQPFPEMASVLAGWKNYLLFGKITKTVVNDEIVDNKIDYSFEGVFEPMTPQALFFKPEGERNWKYWTMWTKIGLDIQNQDLIQDFTGRIFMVVKRTDWSQANYTEYELLENYTKT